MSQGTFISRNVENKSIVWFKNTNQYVVVEPVVKTILEDFDHKKTIEEIADNLSATIEVPTEEALHFVSDIKKNLFDPNSYSLDEQSNKSINPDHIEFGITRFYKVNDTVFKVEFLSEREEFLIQPKFSHIVVDAQNSFDFNYKVFVQDDLIFLFSGDEFIGSWTRENVHYFQGKFSMLLTQDMHGKSEDEWLGVFHASAVSNSKKSVLFLGDSGNGKSTSLALLQANGFTCLADDFVPVDVEQKNAYAFPSGISIKKNSLPVLLPIYPELETTAEYHLKLLNKIVRYLVPNNSDYSSNLPCNELVFIKYEKDAPLQFDEISKIDAFEQLVPDSWLSPIEENAQEFLDWFSKLKCYQLTYSINTEMIAQVTKLFNDEL